MDPIPEIPAHTIQEVADLIIGAIPTDMLSLLRNVQVTSSRNWYGLTEGKYLEVNVNKGDEHTISVNVWDHVGKTTRMTESITLGYDPGSQEVKATEVSRFIPGSELQNGLDTTYRFEMILVGDEPSAKIFATVKGVEGEQLLTEWGSGQFDQSIAAAEVYGIGTLVGTIQSIRSLLNSITG